MKRTLILLSSLILSATLLHAEPFQPRHTIDLTANEFSVLVNAARYGLQKYGGGAEYRVIMVNQGGKLAWKITVNNTALLMAWTKWMEEYNTQLIGSVSTNNITAMQKLSLQTAEQVMTKLVQARQSPIWNTKRVTGRLKQDGERLILQAEDGVYTVSGAKTSEMRPLLGNMVVIHGKHKATFDLEVINFTIRRFNALEMFVMSYCPYARGAELEILKKLDSMPDQLKPTLDVRYIFYKQEKEGRTEFTAMHGEKEIEENLVQMILRDQFAPTFFPYLRLRAESDDSWQELAKQVGLKDSTVAGIQTLLDSERDVMIEQEFDFVTNNYNIKDGSPRFVWEGLPAGKLQDIPAFKDVQVKASSCSSGEQK